jgi:hypothetical protein
MGIMRHLQAVVLAVAATVMGGCATDKCGRDQPPAELRSEPTDMSSAGDVVYLDVALIERPFGDRFLNRDLWEAGDEQGINLELKPLLEQNGLRICQIGGLVPPKLHALIVSPRSCPEPRRLRAEPGKPTVVPIGPPRNYALFQLVGQAGARRLDLEQAHCQFEVVPILEDDERIRLRFTPQVRHGKPQTTPCVEKDPDGPLRWAIEAREPVEEFAQLRWECVLAPNEFVVVGAHLDHAGTIGPCFFLPEGIPAKKQWLLVLRASHVLYGLPKDESLSRVPPIAMQAAWSSARGSER